MALPIIPIVSALTSLAPQIANWIGGDKAEDAATKVADIAKAVTGIDNPKASVSKIIDDPKLQVEFLKLIEVNKANLDKEFLLDRQHARELNADSYMPATIVVLLTVMVFGASYALFYMTIPEPNKEMAYLVFGALVAKWGDAIAYYVGSSRGSAEKSRKLFK